MFPLLEPIFKVVGIKPFGGDRTTQIKLAFLGLNWFAYKSKETSFRAIISFIIYQADKRCFSDYCGGLQ